MAVAPHAPRPHGRDARQLLPRPAPRPRPGHRAHLPRADVDGEGALRAGGGDEERERCVLYTSFSPTARFQHLIASPFN
eukprot:31422-Pelagococcus_subviridis.AAC.24